MGDKKKQNEDMNAFEAAMASLRPKADGLDRQWSDRLADEAGRLCVNPAGHQYACVHCGVAAPRDCPNFRGHRRAAMVDENGTVPFLARSRRRWIWPAVAATMTAMAALLLLMLTVHPAPQIASKGEEHGVTTPLISVVREQTYPVFSGSQRMPEPWYGIGNWSRSPIVSGSETISYLNLREQTLRFGVESWETPVLAIVAPTSAMEAPLSSRQLLDRLLKQQGLSGS
jgi:hypothetical protein